MKIDLTQSEKSTILISLLHRRSGIQKMLGDSLLLSDNLRVMYKKELRELESLLEKLFPGSLERLSQTSMV